MQTFKQSGVENQADAQTRQAVSPNESSTPTTFRKGNYMITVEKNSARFSVRALKRGATTVDHCVYCGREIETTDEEYAFFVTVPAVDDDAAWEKMNSIHALDCEWVTTRAYRTCGYDALRHEHQGQSPVAQYC